jgi:outer membrane protein TolC
MLPSLTVSAGYTARDKESASRSISYFTRRQTLEPSVSQERQRIIADLSFSWSMLDFGLSYFQAKQYADRYLIMEERRRRVVNNIVKDVITTYWSVAMEEALLPQVWKALEEAELAQDRYMKARLDGLTSLVGSLDEEKRLLQISGGLKRVAADLAQSKIHLAALVNIPMNEPYSIVIPREEDYMNPPSPIKDIDAAEDVALYFRPDLREDSYQERIDKNELNKEIMRMIPGISLTASMNYDSNTYLQHNLWAEGMARVTSNLIGLIGSYQQYKAAETQIEVTRTRKLANMIAAMVQVRMAYHQYAIALQDYRDSLTMYDLEQQIYAIVQEESQDGSISELERINRYTDLIVGKMIYFHTLRSVYEAWGNLYFSLGGDLVPSFPENATLEERAALIQAGLENWWAGNLPTLPNTESAQGNLAEMTYAQTETPHIQTEASHAPAGVPDGDQPYYAQPIEAAPVQSVAYAAPEAPAGGVFDYVHQVGAFKQASRAERLCAELQAAGIEAQVKVDGTWNLVLVMSRSEPGEAGTLRDRLAPFGIENIMLVSRTSAE